MLLIRCHFSPVSLLVFNSVRDGPSVLTSIVPPIFSRLFISHLSAPSLLLFLYYSCSLLSRLIGYSTFMGSAIEFRMSSSQMVSNRSRNQTFSISQISQTQRKVGFIQLERVCGANGQVPSHRVSTKFSELFIVR